MEFRTVIPRINQEYKIDHMEKIFCIGSCFAQHIYRKLKDNSFNVIESNFGIVFNSECIRIQLQSILKAELLKDYEVNEYNGLYHTWLHHGRYSNTDKDQFIDQINSDLHNSHQFLKEADTLIITFGNAYYYSLTFDGKLVSNCHKYPSSYFNKNGTDLDLEVQEWIKLLNELISFNPKLNLLLTVSPVRYLKEGFINNSRSKARLILLCEALQKEINYIHYFPSYEIFMDDLRDYRFVESDLVHPNSIAVDYIWNYFSDLYFTAETIYINKRINEIRLLQNHRPLHPNTDSANQTIELLQTKIELFHRDFPDIPLM